MGIRGRGEGEDYLGDFMGVGGGRLKFLYVCTGVIVYLSRANSL